METIEESYKRLLFYYSKMWDRKYGYIELIKVLSLGVLFKVNRSDMFELEQRLISEKFDDRLVNFLIKEIDSTWEREGVEFEFEVYECLKQILDNDEKIIACEALKEYLQENGTKYIGNVLGMIVINQAKMCIMGIGVLKQVLLQKY